MHTGAPQFVWRRAQLRYVDAIGIILILVPAGSRWHLELHACGGNGLAWTYRGDNFTPRHLKGRRAAKYDRRRGNSPGTCTFHTGKLRREPILTAASGAPGVG